MDIVSLSAQARSAEARAKDLRREGIVPCVLYGNDTENAHMQCERSVLEKAFQQAGESTLVELDTGSKKVPVLFHAVEFEPVSGAIMHVDFYAVDMKKEIEARVSIVLEGEAPAVEELGGILITPYDHVTVKCLPTALPQHLTVSIEALVEFGSRLVVGDITVPEGVAISDDPETVIATVQEPRKEEEIEPTPVEGEEAEGAEGEEGEKVEGEEGEGDGEPSSDKAEEGKGTGDKGGEAKES